MAESKIRPYPDLPDPSVHNPPPYGVPPPQPLHPPMDQGMPHHHPYSPHPHQAMPMQPLLRPSPQPPSAPASTAGGPTTVIVTQPLPSTAIVQPRAWSTSIVGCFDDCGICLCGICCPMWLAAKNALDMGESLCIPCWVPGGLIALRTKWRTQENIQGSICGDCIDLYFCFLCANCQLAREVKGKRNGTLRV